MLTRDEQLTINQVNLAATTLYISFNKLVFQLGFKRPIYEYIGLVYHQHGLLRRGVDIILRQNLLPVS